ncbi:MAG: hypothetical protein HKL81_04610 [Acidimicrobiaceae bacterium]|nr:hypothetical protein [Acidimicrobiaceae bacterium]
MMARIRWMVLGATAAVWVTLKTQGEFRKRVERSKPDQLLTRVQQRAESLRASVKNATFEGIASAKVELDRLNED